MKSISERIRKIVVVMMIGLSAIGLTAQTSLPAPGSGGSSVANVAPTYGSNYNGIGWNPGPPPPSYWGSPWYNGWNTGPTTVLSPTVSANFQNQGTTKVVACGYDSQGIWRVIPLLVSYQYNGVQYVVNVLNAWNPWTDTWNVGVDVPAYNTSYVLRNITYDFYTVLSTGTYYFNL